MNGLWTTEERNRWASIRGRLDFTKSDLRALAQLTEAPGYHLSRRDRADIDRMIEVLLKVRDGALPCPDEVQESGRRAA